MSHLIVKGNASEIIRLCELGHEWEPNSDLLAVRSGDIDIVEVFLTRLGSTFFSKESFIESLLYSLEISELLYSHGVRICSMEERSIYNAFSSVITQNIKGGVEFLFDKGYYANEDIFSLAVELKRDDMIEYLYNSGCPIDYDVLNQCADTNNTWLLGKLIESREVEASVYVWNLVNRKCNYDMIKLVHDHYLCGDGERDCKYCDIDKCDRIENDRENSYSSWISESFFHKLRECIKSDRYSLIVLENIYSTSEEEVYDEVEEEE